MKLKTASAVVLGGLLCLSFGVFGGCVVPPTTAQTSGAAVPMAAAEADVLRLNAGDVIKVAFPGAPNLETTQQIRRDGRINLAVVGEVMAAEKTPAELEAELVRLYSSQIVSKEIKVTVISSSFAVFVTGAVLKPGKISSERTVTALEAIMEAGGFDSTKADMKAVVVIRNEGGTTKNFVLDMQAVLQGRTTEPFYLKSHDIVYVPEKFSWF